MCIYQERKFYLYKRRPNFLVHARPLKSQSRDCAELVVVVRRGGGEGTAVRSKATDDGAVGWGGGRGVTDSGAVGGGGLTDSGGGVTSTANG
jgi:hypothetical protein